VLLSVAERAGAVELAPARGGMLAVRLTGRGSPRKALLAIRAAKDRAWESYRSIERFTTREVCRRRQILDRFGDASEGAPSGRACHVCDPDAALGRAPATTPVTTRRPRRSRGTRRAPSVRQRRA